MVPPGGRNTVQESHGAPYTSNPLKSHLRGRMQLMKDRVTLRGPKPISPHTTSVMAPMHAEKESDTNSRPETNVKVPPPASAMLFMRAGSWSEPYLQAVS
jgi:hypothetical protein